MELSGNTFLFIPDISGFTDFVNSTELEHSRHIISELLEIIIYNDILGLTISEIEGDAVLFYKKDVPSVEQIVRQVQKTFIKFHTHLKRYETERICRCGACRTASGLSLKFIAHVGDIQFIDIIEHKKLHGVDNIIAHKLLKNSIPENEYLLLSNNISKNINRNKIVTDFSWLQFEKGKTTYKNIGEIIYQYIPLKPLHQYILGNAILNLPVLNQEDIQLSYKINASVDVIYKNLTDLKKRKEWNKDIREIKRHNNQLYKAGSKHTCIIKSGKLEIETQGRNENAGEIIYSERIKSFFGLRDINRIFTIRGHKNHAHLDININFKSDLVMVNSFRLFWVWILRMMSKREFRMLKNYSELN